MSKILGLGGTEAMADIAKRYWQIGLETTPGTAVAATRKIYGTGEMTKVAPQRAVEEDRGSYDARFVHLPAVIEAAASFEAQLYTQQLIELLQMAIEAGVTGVQQGITTAYLWTWVPGDTLKSATLEYFDGQKAWEMPYGMADSLRIWGAITGDCRMAVEMLGKDKEATTMTPALPDPTVTPIAGWEAKLYMDAFGGTPGTTAKDGLMIDYDVKIVNGLARLYTAANTNLIDAITRGKRLLDAGFTFEFNTDAETEYTNFLTPTKRLIRLELGNNTVIEDTYKHYVTIDIPGIWTGAVVGEDENTCTIKMDCENEYDPTNTFAYQVRVMTARAS